MERTYFENRSHCFQFVGLCLAGLTALNKGIEDERDPAHRSDTGEGDKKKVPTLNLICH